MDGTAKQTKWSSSRETDPKAITRICAVYNGGFLINVSLPGMPSGFSLGISPAISVLTGRADDRDQVGDKEDMAVSHKARARQMLGKSKIE